MSEKQAILAASFGTTHRETLEKNITAIEDALRAAFPGRTLRRAFTSGLVRARLRQRDGLEVDEPGLALDRLAAEGFARVTVQPTHVVAGEEYEKLAAVCESRAGCFKSLRIGAPLLASREDCRGVLRALAEAYAGLEPDAALVLIGHGSAHPAHAMYGLLEALAREEGRSHIFVGAVEAQPDAAAVCRALRETPCRRVLLAPLMVVAGDHAKNDIAGGDEESWRSVFTRAGYAADYADRGLGEYEAIRRIYTAHAGEAL